MARTYVGRVTKQCEKCGSTVSRRNSAYKEHVFCSRACYLTSDYFIGRRDASNAARYADKREQRPCLTCGTTVDRPVSQFTSRRTFCSVACRRSHFIAAAHRQTNSNGYVLIFVGKEHPSANRHGYALEHRYVMEQHLGRSLTPDENVHHKNGDRADNRLANLELWTKSQPPGQRVEDKIAWAREFLAFYNATSGACLRDEPGGSSA